MNSIVRSILSTGILLAGMMSFSDNALAEGCPATNPALAADVRGAVGVAPINETGLFLFGPLCGVSDAENPLTVEAYDSIFSNTLFGAGEVGFAIALPASGRPAPDNKVKISCEGDGDEKADCTVACTGATPAATITGSPGKMTEIALADGQSCALEVSAVPASGMFKYGTTLSRAGVNYHVSVGEVLGGAFNPKIVSAILPSARATVVGGTVTAFGIIVNSSGSAANNCRVSAPENNNMPIVPGTFTYQTTNAMNQLTGTPNTPVNISDGASQSFVFSFTPTSAISQNLEMPFTCDNTPNAPVTIGVNSFLLSAQSTQPVDMISVAAESTNTGIVALPSNDGQAVFAVSAINIGASGTVTVSVGDTPFGGADPNMRATLTLCQSNPTTGACLSSIGSQVEIPVNTNEVVTFSIFVQGQGIDIPFRPSFNRAHVRMTQGALPVGGTSVAIRTQ